MKPEIQYRLEKKIRELTHEIETLRPYKDAVLSLYGVAITNISEAKNYIHASTFFSKIKDWGCLK